MSRVREVITADRVREMLRYVPETGKLYWSSSSKRVKAGSEAGCLWNKPTSRHLQYRQIRLDGRLYYAHRLVWLLAFGAWPDGEIDHIDGDGLNNRLSNLRLVSPAGNRRNSSRSVANTSGVTGVSWDRFKGNWQAYIRADGKKKSLGGFDSLKEAVVARKAAERRHNFHPNHGLSVEARRRIPPSSRLY